MGVVHRDLKPHNVIVDDEGKAVVTDFGIARAGVSEITQTGSVMGTPHYLSPEQAQGEDVTPVSDLYSIGVMLYEALAGRVPFEGESAVAVAMKQVSQAPQRPSSINPKVSPALDAVVMRALEKSPGDRFQNADAFIAALDNALKAGDELRGGTAAFAPLPPAVAVISEAEAAEMDAIEEEERRRRRRLWILAAIAVLLGILIALALTRDTTAEVPKVTGRSLERAETRLEGEGFKIGETARSRERSGTRDRARAGPDPGRSRRRLLVRQLLLLEAGSDPHGQHRPRQRQGAVDRRPAAGEGDSGARRGGLRGPGRPGQLRQGRARAW